MCRNRSLIQSLLRLESRANFWVDFTYLNRESVLEMDFHDMNFSLIPRKRKQLQLTPSKLNVPQLNPPKTEPRSSNGDLGGKYEIHII